MLSKYKDPLFLFFCAGLFALGLFFLYPFVFTSYKQEEQQIENLPITHTNSKTTIWKNGSFASTTTVKEAFATTNNLDEIEHSSKGWATIHWKKEKK